MSHKIISSISLLGSTGSIGTQTLDVARKLNIKIVALAANRNIKLLEKQAREFNPKIVAVYDKSAAQELKIKLADTSIKVLEGIEGLCEAAACREAELTLNSVVGMIGLQPTIAALNAKKNVALANKETLVAGGSLVMDLANKNNLKILPVDSEHSAIFQCLQGCPDKNFLKRLILTASGGPFFGKKIDDLKAITVQQALNHPNWSMGAKITIDSATMMNKGLELIEAKWLFDVPVSDIDVVVHRESIIHSLVEYKDNSVIAQLGLPDMQIPIQYAITYPQRYESNVKQLDLCDIGNLSFYRPDEETFKCLKLCRDAVSKGGTSPAIANAANEEAVSLFLNEKIKFLDIGDIIENALKTIKSSKVNNIEDVLNADNETRNFVRKKFL